MSYRDDTQRAAIADLLCSSVHRKGIRFTVDRPSDNALAAIDAAEANQLLERIIGTFRSAWSHSHIARFLDENLWALSVDDDDVLLLSCHDQEVEERFARDYHKAVQQRAELFEIKGVRIVRDAPSLAMSSGEGKMVRVAWAIWNGRGAVTLPELLHTLDSHNLLKLGTLLIAMSGGSSALDTWIRDWAEREEVRRG